MKQEIPRRNRLDLNEPAELAIHNAMQEVEKIGAGVRLTDAVVLLAKAKDLVSDFIDSIKSFKYGDRVYSKNFPSLHCTYLCVTPYMKTACFILDDNHSVKSISISDLVLLT